jgi:hypothetical protein
MGNRRTKATARGEGVLRDYFDGVPVTRPVLVIRPEDWDAMSRQYPHIKSWSSVRLLGHLLLFGPPSAPLSPAGVGGPPLLSAAVVAANPSAN